ncbi:MAG: hypothetical protein NC489_16610 [Ruminococcus flavefaciens]|nr:hypothetical protein [Ruminococcus flavefaciens]
MKIKEYVENAGGLYIDLNPMFKITENQVPTENLSVAQRYRRNAYEYLAELWGDNSDMVKSAELAIKGIDTAIDVNVTKDAVSFDDYGWDKHLTDNFPTAATQSEKYGFSSKMLVAATIMRKFYDSNSGIMCIAYCTKAGFTVNAITDCLERWLGKWEYYMSRNMLHCTVRDSETSYSLYFTTPKDAATFIRNCTNIDEVVHDHEYNHNPTTIVERTVNNWFTPNGVSRFGLDLYRCLGIEVPDIDADDLPIEYRMDPLPVGGDRLDSQLVVPTKTKFKPLAFAGAVFTAYGYIMDLTNIPVNARFPKLSKVTKRVSSWTGTGADYRAAVETIIQHCMKYGNTITVKQETSGIELTGANPAEPDADEE